MALCTRPSISRKTSVFTPSISSSARRTFLALRSNCTFPRKVKYGHTHIYIYIYLTDSSVAGGYVLYGRGLESDGVRVGDRVEVIVEPESVDSPPSVNEGQIALAVRKR